MKTESEVRKKLREVKKEYLSREYRAKLGRCPENCIYNYRHKVTLSDGEVSEVGLCMYGSGNPEEWNGNICDDIKTAEECPLFTLRHDKETVKTSFEDSLKDPRILANQYKDIAALQWALESDVQVLEEDSPSTFDENVHENEGLGSTEQFEGTPSLLRVDADCSGDSDDQQGRKSVFPRIWYYVVSFLRGMGRHF
jgi:hypothetical protein